MSNLCFLGDVWLPHAVKSNMTLQGEFIFNLESPITRSCTAMPDKINLKAEDNYIRDTFGRAPIAVCLANNHIMDYCDEGFNDTVASLKKEGIRHFGAGRLADNCHNPLVLEIDGASVAVLGYAAGYTSAVLASQDCLGAMPADPDLMLRDIEAARNAGAGRIVVSLHWGAQYVYLPNPEAVRTAHALINAGADLVIGHHAHRIQPYEFYKGKYIFYGLGNCVFPEVPVLGQFDHAGRPRRRYRNKLYRSDRFSLAVGFEVETRAVRVSVLKFDGTTLNVTAQNAKRHMMEFSSLEGYDKRFKRSYACGKTRRAVMRYIWEPKIPRLRHVKSLVSLLFTREYPVYS